MAAPRPVPLLAKMGQPRADAEERHPLELPRSCVPSEQPPRLRPRMVARAPASARHAPPNQFGNLCKGDLVGRLYTVQPT
jgi:hypothetical protein